MTQLTLKVGGNFVNINAAGVQINGTMVLINSGGAAVRAARPRLFRRFPRRLPTTLTTQNPERK
jgi:hypothetical protein